MFYSQSTGFLWDEDGTLIAKGYSGFGEGKNSSAKEHIVSVGPIPKGVWVLTEVYDSSRVGKFAIILEPSGHSALGRTYFRIHGDSAKNPGGASKGCIVLQKSIRQSIWASKDRILKVIG